MVGYIKNKQEFINDDNEKILNELKLLYPLADVSQIKSWETLICDLKGSSIFNELPNDIVIAIEYSLPTNGMGIDVMLCGYNDNNEKVAFIIESKQWNDNYIKEISFSDYREEGKELHPQIQVGRHKLSFNSYLTTGHDYIVYPFVFIRNCSANGIQIVRDANVFHINVYKNIPIDNQIDRIMLDIKSVVKYGTTQIKNELLSAEYKPSKDIIEAMKSIVTKEEPFILTKEQSNIVQEVKNNIKQGKKVVRITGAAGSGKTAILLNLYVELLNDKEISDIRPIFVSGAQNTAYYRSVYPEVERSFEYSYSLEKVVAKTKGNLYVILMDEAQHNQEGIITKMIERGATLILCYDISQVINAHNAIQELKELENRSDFVSLELKDSVRFNGSKVAESNVRKYLKGQLDFEEDNLFEFKPFYSFDEFQKAIIEKISSDKESTFAVAGLLSNDSKEYTIESNPKSKLFTKWGNKAECEWMPYVINKDYLSKNDGNLCVGTWWMPGLDVDYIAVIVGGDAVLTKKGLQVVPEQAKHYRMMVSVAEQLNLPSNLVVERNSFGKMVTDFRKSSNNIIDYISKKENSDKKEKFIDLFSKLLRNNYYIMMSRGRKGCFVFFANNTTKD